MDFKNHNKGFTFIELLIVVAIMGVMATFSIVSFRGSQKQARDSVRRSDLRQIQTLLETYANSHNGFYPRRDLSGAGVNVSVVCSDMGLSFCPSDPKDGQNACGNNGTQQCRYMYQSDTPCATQGSACATKYVLWEKLENTNQYFVLCSNGRTGLAAYTLLPPAVVGTCPL